MANVDIGSKWENRSSSSFFSFICCISNFCCLLRPMSRTVALVWEKTYSSQSFLFSLSVSLAILHQQQCSRERAVITAAFLICQNRKSALSQCLRVRACVRATSENAFYRSVSVASEESRNFPVVYQSGFLRVCFCRPERYIVFQQIAFGAFKLTCSIISISGKRRCCTIDRDRKGFFLIADFAIYR